MPTLRRTRKLISSQRLDDSPRQKQTIKGLVEELWHPFDVSVAKAEEMDRWYRNELDTADMPKTPDRTRRDINDLKDAAPTSWAKMICDSMSQDLVIDGIQQQDTGQDAPAWRLFEQNGLGGRSKPVHDGVIRHGKAFNLIGEAVGRLDGQRTAFIRGKSALTSDAFFRDDFDEFPEFFIERRLQVDDRGDKVWFVDLYDEANHHRLQGSFDGTKWDYIDYEPHGFDGLVPVVRAAGNIDLTGRVMGEIEPYIRTFKRINQSTMDRLVVQRFGAFVIRWLAGIDKPKTDAEQRAQAIALGLTDLLVIEKENGKAGALPGTPLDGYIRARESDIRDLAAVSQTPSFHMLGLSDNVGAEGLAAAEASHMRKVELWKISLGEFWETSMRLAGHAAGNREIEQDFQSRIHWKDTSAQSFQSLAQGLQALAEGLGIPGEVLWPRVLEPADIERAKKAKLAEEARLANEAEEAQQRTIEQIHAKGQTKAVPRGDAG